MWSHMNLPPLPPPLPHMLGQKIEGRNLLLTFLDAEKVFLLSLSPSLQIYNAENQCELSLMQKNRVVVLLQKLENLSMALT